MNLTVIAGGIGAAKLVEGLAAVHDNDTVDVIVNVGDDIEMHGLRICPDFDTIAYTLAGIIDPVKRWGIEGETYNCLAMLGRYLGDEQWFNLGDKDLATHVYRTMLLSQGHPLDEVAATIARRLGITLNLVPCTNDPLHTTILDDGGRVLPFQDYFVKERATPVVQAITFEGASRARPSPGATTALSRADRIIICPSNPYLSIDPVLAVPGIRAALQEKRDVTAFVSPIVGGEAIKGPTAKIMRELGIVPSCVSVARHYRDVSSMAVIDQVDASHRQDIETMGFTVSCTNTIMDTFDKRVQLARDVARVLGMHGR